MSPSNNTKNTTPEDSTKPPPASYGANEGWTIDYNRRRARCAGHGLFTGLQDQKNYAVDGGWASRKEQGHHEPLGFFGTLKGLIAGGGTLN